MKYFLGIEIGGTKFQAVVGNSQARIISRYRSDVVQRLGGEGIRKDIRKAITCLARHDPLSIGVGFGGPIDFEKGIIRTSHQIEGWNDFPIGPWLEEISGLPVRVDNDANVAALAEALKGRGKEHRRVFYVTLGSGMGGGMIVNGRIYHGEAPGESEIGLMPFDRTMTTMESRCSGWSVDAQIRKYTKANPKSILATLTKAVHGGETKYLTEAIEKGDSGAAGILEATAENIAFALSYVVLLFHPGIIIIGGGLSLIGTCLVEKINKYLPSFIVPSFHPVPCVKIAALGEDAVSVGALLLAIQENNRVVKASLSQNRKKR